jgi:hypothetical protein
MPVPHCPSAAGLPPSSVVVFGSDVVLFFSKIFETCEVLVNPSSDYWAVEVLVGST